MFYVMYVELMVFIYVVIVFLVGVMLFMVFDVVKDFGKVEKIFFLLDLYICLYIVWFRDYYVIILL